MKIAVSVSDVWETAASGTETAILRLRGPVLLRRKQSYPWKQSKEGASA